MKLQTFRKFYFILTAIAILILFTISEVRAQEQPKPSEKALETLQTIRQISECKAAHYWAIHTIGTAYVVEVYHFGDKAQSERIGDALDDIFLTLEALGQKQRHLAYTIEKEVTIQQLQSAINEQYNLSMMTIGSRIMGVQRQNVLELKKFMISFKETKKLCERFLNDK